MPRTLSAPLSSRPVPVLLDRKATTSKACVLIVHPGAHPILRTDAKGE